MLVSLSGERVDKDSASDGVRVSADWGGDINSCRCFIRITTDVDVMLLRQR